MRCWSKKSKRAGRVHGFGMKSVLEHPGLPQLPSHLNFVPLDVSRTSTMWCWPSHGSSESRKSGPSVWCAGFPPRPSPEALVWDIAARPPSYRGIMLRRSASDPVDARQPALLHWKGERVGFIPLYENRVPGVSNRERSPAAGRGVLHTAGNGRSGTRLDGRDDPWPAPWERRGASGRGKTVGRPAPGVERPMTRSRAPGPRVGVVVSAIRPWLRVLMLSGKPVTAVTC